MNYLNTNEPILLFKNALKNKLYVDKSLLISEINRQMSMGQNYICITRPRRFGKTINAAMLGAYYTKGYDSRDLFEGLAIQNSEEYERNLNQHNVIYIDFSRIPDFCETYKDYISAIIKQFHKDFARKYPQLNPENYDYLSELISSTGEEFIFILDEWDSIFYEDFMSSNDKKKYLKFLKGLLKDKPYVELAYMTGILPIAKYSSGSELNMFDEYTFMNDNIFDRYFGFDETEVIDLCRQYPTISYEELKYWYDGYYTSSGTSLFNPRSVNKALLRGKCLNYWTETGPMNEIADVIEHNVEEVRDDIVSMIAGGSVEAELGGYSAAEQQLATRDEILSAMVVYGFLSCHDGMLRIPNHELMEKFQSVLSRESFGDVKKIVDRSKEILEATISCKEQKIAELLEYVHDLEIPLLQYNDENSLSCVITLCYLYARNHYRIERELHTGKGFCDFIFFPKRKGTPGIILELKKGHSCVVSSRAPSGAPDRTSPPLKFALRAKAAPEEAIRQIKEKNYMQKLEECSEILLVGINYNEKKHHECKIEKWKLP